jgi:hypothetical protein
MALTYATPADMAAWTAQPAPLNATQLLRSASILVTRFTGTAFYQTDTTGLPTDAGIAEAFKDATTAQAAFWAAANIDPASAGFATSGILSSKKIGSASLTYDVAGAGSVQAFNERRRMASSLCDEAVNILQQQGLYTNGPWVVG